jgi:hypothetical protein
VLKFASFSEGGKSRLFCLDVLGPVHRVQREPTSGLEPLTCSLRVCGQWLLSVARVCKSRISKPLSLLLLALCCTVLRSRWYQSGIKTSVSYSLTAGPMRQAPTFGATIRRHVFLGVATRCRNRLSKPISLLAVACCFCVLRPEWCQKWCQYPHRVVDRSPQGPSAQTKLWWREAAGGSTMNMQNSRRTR